MKRVAMTIAVIGILAMATGQALAHGPHHHNGHRYGCGPVTVYRPVHPVPRVVVPYPVRPPVYRYYGYYPYTAGGFYYNGPRVSVGVGF